MSEEMATYWFNKMYELGIIHEVLRQEGVIKWVTFIKAT